MLGINVGGAEMIIPSQGLFALVESLKEPLDYPGVRSGLVVKESKRLTKKAAKETKD
jgi:hypothetical protein